MRGFRTIVTLALGAGLLVQASAASEYIFRYKTGGGTATVPGVGEPVEPPAPPPANYRVDVEAFDGSAAGAISRLRFVRNGAPIAPTSVTASDGSDATGAFVGSGGAWTGSANVSFDFVLPAGSAPDALSIVAANANAPQSFAVRNSHNGEVWRPIISVAPETGWSTAEERVYPFDPTRSETDPEEMGAKRFWRVAVPTSGWNPGSLVRSHHIQEITYRNARGEDVTAGGKFGVDGPRSSYFAERLYDKGSGDWQSSQIIDVPTYLWYEFAEPVAITSVDLTAGTQRMIREFRVESSDDGRRWTAEGSFVGQANWESGETRSFELGFRQPPAGHFQFWRVKLLEMNGSLTGLNYLRFRGADDQFLDGKAAPFASSNKSSLLHASSITQGGTNRYDWQPADGDTQRWVGYTFDRPVAPTSIVLGALRNPAPRAFEIQHSVDGDVWKTSSTHRGQGEWGKVGSYEERTFQVHYRPAQAPGTHRFWRVHAERPASATAEYAAISEMRFVDAGGRNVHERGVPIAGGTTVRGPANAFDGTTNNSLNEWRGEPNGSWVGYEFPEALRPHRLVIWGDNANHPGTFTIDRSDDGVRWTTVSRFRNHASWSYDSRIFDVEPAPAAEPGAHHFWRISATRNHGGSDLVVRELEFLRDGVRVPTRFGYAFASSQQATWNASRLFDRDTGQWQSTVAPSVLNPVTFGYAFVEPVRVNGLSIQTQSIPNSLRDFVLEHSDDGVNWSAAGAVEDTGTWTINGTRRFLGAEGAGGDGYTYRATVVATPLADQPAAPPTWATGNRLRVTQVSPLDGGGRPVVAPHSARSGGGVGDPGTWAHQWFNGLPDTWSGNSGRMTSVAFVEYMRPVNVTGVDAVLSPGCACDVEVRLEVERGGSFVPVASRTWRYGDLDPATGFTR